MKTLLKEEYKTYSQRSSGKIVLSHAAAQRLYGRFADRNPSVYEQGIFEWVRGWSFGQFHDANNLELIENYGESSKTCLKERS